MSVDYNNFIPVKSNNNIKRIKAKVVSCTHTNETAIVETIDNKVRIELYNKTGELLSDEDYVTVEYSKILSSKTAYIKIRNGSPKFISKQKIITQSAYDDLKANNLIVNDALYVMPSYRKPFSEYTVEEVLSMLQKHYNNQINISDYWKIGDKRTIYFFGTSTTIDIKTAHPACNIDIRIIGIEHDDLVTPINGHTKAAITVEFVNSLANGCYIWGKSVDLSDSDVWSNSPRRAWLNSKFKYALPSTISSAIKTVIKTTKAPHSGDTTETTNDDVFLLSVYEVYKDTDTSYSSTTNKIVEGSQYKFYEIASDRILTDYYVGTKVRCYRWLRSPAVTRHYNGSYYHDWCHVYSELSVMSDVSSTHGLAPAFCM